MNLKSSLFPRRNETFTFQVPFYSPNVPFSHTVFKDRNSPFADCLVGLAVRREAGAGSAVLTVEC